ncbi:MAG TPA: hypothetical protein VFF06_16010 [Polyangia bacterium]|nr:hypothetical protein [Polyangia bacterium]
MRFALLILVAAAGCGGSSTLREPDEYVGCGSDEHWRTFDDREKAGQVMVSATQGPIVTAPTGTVPFSMRPRATWQRGQNDPGMPAGDVPYLNGPGCNMCCPEFNTGGLGTLHLPPISGDVYDLQFSIGGSIVWRVITTLQEWAPPTMPADPWPSWRGQLVTIKLIKMDVEANDPKAGPFVSPTPFTFTVGN